MESYELKKEDTICSKCGKPFIYVGDTHDIFKGFEPWCTCNNKLDSIINELKFYKNLIKGGKTWKKKLITLMKRL